jgi:hypothetical protein
MRCLMRWNRLWLCVGLFGFAHVSNAQADTLSRAILQTEVSVLAGRLVKIHGEYPPNDITTVAELNLSWKTLGRKLWQQQHGYPTAGFSIAHAQLGNQDVLGQAIGFIPTLRLDRERGGIRWSARAGLGVAYFFKPYHSTDNPQNLVIGSPWANMTIMKVEASRPINELWRYHFGLSFMHCSNAHVDVPNIGANLLALHVAFSYAQRDISKRAATLDKNKFQYKHPWNVGVQGILGLHEFKGTIRPVDGPTYLVYGASAFMSRMIHSKGRVAFGINYHYYNAYHDYALSQELFGNLDNVRSKSQNLVLFASYEWMFGRLGFFLQGGLNVYDPFIHAYNKVWDIPKSSFINLYTANKIGYKVYAFSQNKSEALPRLIQPYLQVAVKTNGGTADFLEIGIGAHIGARKIQRLDTSSK